MGFQKAGCAWKWLPEVVEAVQRRSRGCPVRGWHLPFLFPFPRRAFLAILKSPVISGLQSHAAFLLVVSLIHHLEYSGVLRIRAIRSAFNVISPQACRAPLSRLLRLLEGHFLVYSPQLPVGIN